MKIIFLRILRVKGGKALVDNYFIFASLPLSRENPYLPLPTIYIIPVAHILKPISHIKRVYNYYNKYNTRTVRINIFYKSIYTYVMIFVVGTYEYIYL